MDNVAIDRDLLPNIKTCFDKGETFIRNQAEGTLWIIPNVACIRYVTDESSVEVSLLIFNTVVEKKVVSVTNPLCFLEGSVGFAKAKFEICIDIPAGRLTAKGTACVRELLGARAWHCVPDKVWTLLNW